MSGKLIVVSGPSGVGKSTVVKKVMEQSPNLHFSVSVTTRPKRPSETEGVSYFFVDQEKFLEMIQREELLEYARYVENYYGTPAAPVDASLTRGEDILLDVEPQGALNVKRLRPEAILVFLAAPSFSVLESRLRGRGDTAPELIEKRLKQARWEYSQAPNYDYVVVNDDVDVAANELLSIITAEKCRTKERMNYLKEDL